MFYDVCVDASSRPDSVGALDKMTEQQRVTDLQSAALQIISSFRHNTTTENTKEKANDVAFGTARRSLGGLRPRPCLLVVPNVTAHPSTTDQCSVY